MIYTTQVHMNHECKVEAPNDERAKVYAIEKARYDGNFSVTILDRVKDIDDYKEEIEKLEVFRDSLFVAYAKLLRAAEEWTNIDKWLLDNDIDAYTLRSTCNMGSDRSVWDETYEQALANKEKHEHR